MLLLLRSLDNVLLLSSSDILSIRSSDDLIIRLTDVLLNRSCAGGGGGNGGGNHQKKLFCSRGSVLWNVYVVQRMSSRRLQNLPSLLRFQWLQTDQHEIATVLFMLEIQPMRLLSTTNNYRKQYSSL